LHPEIKAVSGICIPNSPDTKFVYNNVNSIFLQKSILFWHRTGAVP
jgi:hypothetical protein